MHGVGDFQCPKSTKCAHGEKSGVESPVIDGQVLEETDDFYCHGNTDCEVETEKAVRKGVATAWMKL